MKKEIIEITKEVQINEDTILEVGDKFEVLKESHDEFGFRGDTESDLKRYFFGLFDNENSSSYVFDEVKKLIEKYRNEYSKVMKITTGSSGVEYLDGTW